MRAWLGWMVVASIGSTGCESRDASKYIGHMDDDFPAGTCRDTGSGGTAGRDVCGEPGSSTGARTTDESAAECVTSDDCESGVCAATVEENLGAFTCVPTCIELMDEASWCADETACCDPTATCTVRGYCALP